MVTLVESRRKAYRNNLYHVFNPSVLLNVQLFQNKKLLEKKKKRDRLMDYSGRFCPPREERARCSRDPQRNLPEILFLILELNTIHSI